MPDLRRIQRGFQDLIVLPHEKRATRRSPSAATLLTPLRNLSPDESADLYSGMYFQRLRDCLAEDFPAVVKVVGPAFDGLARAYFERHPSRSYSLNPLGSRFPDFLDDGARVARRGLVRDVARVELAFAEAFDAEPSPVLQPEAVTGVRSWPRTRVHPVASLRLLALEHDVATSVIKLRRTDGAVPRFRKKRCWLAVYRKDFVVSFLDLTEPLFHVLSGLARGWTLGRALRAGQAVAKGDLEAEIFRAFGIWTRQGILSSLS